MIQHVALEVREVDAEAEVAFWALLGFEEVAPPRELAARSRWVAREGTQVHLLWADDPVVPTVGHVAVVCPEHAATLDRLRAAGLAPQLRTEYWGAARAFVRSPAGHRVEVMAAPPA